MESRCYEELVAHLASKGNRGIVLGVILWFDIEIISGNYRA